MSQVIVIESYTTLVIHSLHSLDELSIYLARYQRHLIDCIFINSRFLLGLKLAQEKTESHDLCIMKLLWMLENS